jgi:peptidoglycan/xylan/chitin deacetylase (PgdA/CDA1 family)
MEGQEHRKFVKYVNWCQDAGVECHPNILCQELDKFPETLDYLKEELIEERISLDLHGWTHGPYQDLSVAEVDEHLDRALDWFALNLAWVPIRWVTPHGSDSPAMRESAAMYGLVIETCDDPVIDQKVAASMLLKTRSLDFLDGAVIMSHWWLRGLSLYHVLMALQYGSIEAAIEETKGDMVAKEHGKVWDGWR